MEFIIILGTISALTWVMSKMDAAAAETKTRKINQLAAARKHREITAKRQRHFKDPNTSAWSLETQLKAELQKRGIK